MSSEEIVQDLDVPSTKRRGAAGTRTGVPCNKWNSKEESLLIELTDSGWSDRDIGTYLGRSTSAITQHRRKLNMKKPFKVYPSTYKKAEQTQNSSTEGESGSKVTPEERVTSDEKALLDSFSTIFNVLQKQLYSTIYEATYAAMKRALNE